jgi:two-component sensor histidine kinase/PAS domain-containing protein
MQMAKADEQADKAGFLRCSGATAARIAEYDWASTPLGPLESWSQTLRTTVGLVLRSPQMMALMWGEEGVILFNDAFAGSPSAHRLPPLGSKVREAWPELADFNDRVIRTVLSGESLAYRDYEMTVHPGGRPETVWLDLDYSPVVDEHGRPVAVLSVVVETTERVLADRRAAAQAERQRRLLEEAPGFVCLLAGPDHVVEFTNAAYRRLFGERDAVGKPLYEAYPELAPNGPASLDRVFHTGERLFSRAASIRVRPRPDEPDQERFADFVLEPVTGDAGQITGVFVEGFDVTESVRAQAAVLESERRLSAAVALARLGTFEWNLETREATLDARAREIFGFDPQAPLTIDDVVARIDREDMPRLEAQNVTATAARRHRREFEYRIHLPDCSVRNIASISDSVLGSDGRQVRIIGVFDDVTERRRAENRQRLLINELNHRVKNTLATVQSIAAQTLRATPDPAKAREAFDARLVALATAHDLLTAQSWRGARLTDVVAQAIAAFETAGEPQISHTGPPVWVNAHDALALSLALHELATNAAKYGALSGPEGRVVIQWTLVRSELTFTWTEQGGPPVAPPSRSGFGSRLLRRSLAHDLHGEVTLVFAPEGVRCTIRCSLEDADAMPDPQIAQPEPTLFGLYTGS